MLIKDRREELDALDLAMCSRRSKVQSLLHLTAEVNDRKSCVDQILKKKSNWQIAEKSVDLLNNLELDEAVFKEY